LLLDTCGRAGRLDDALAVYAKAEEDGFVADILTVNSLIRHYVASELPDKAYDTYIAVRT